MQIKLRTVSFSNQMVKMIATEGTEGTEFLGYLIFIRSFPELLVRIKYN